MTVTVRLAAHADVDWLAANDRHLERRTLDEKVARAEILVADLAAAPIGWLRWSYFWDQIPFMNLLQVDVALRGRSYGRTLTLAWEQRMC